jgi:hypothetical protein
MSVPEHSHHTSHVTSTENRPAHPDGNPQQPGFWRSKAGFVAIGFLLIAAFLLLSEHRAHALGYLPFLLLLACPLLHFFMHGSHGGGGHRSHAGPARKANDINRADDSSGGA